MRVLYTRKQVAKRQTRRSYGLDPYFTCRSIQIQSSANALLGCSLYFHPKVLARCDNYSDSLGRSISTKFDDAPCNWRHQPAAPWL